MASEGRAPAGEAAPVKAEGGKTKEFLALLVKYRVFIICGILVMASTATIIVMVVKYLELRDRQWPIYHPFKELRGSLAVAANTPKFLFNKPEEVAEEAKLVWVRIKKANEIQRWKKKYCQSFFLMSAAGSYGYWQFHGKSLYYFSKGEKTWYDAEDFCSAQGAHLASILDDEEQKYISSQLQHTAWIGLTHQNEEGKWKWSDGSSLVKEYWSKDQPTNSKVSRKSNQDCAEIVPSLADLNWKNNDCQKSSRWVCKDNLDLGTDKDG